MPKFVYEATDSRGKTVSGIVNAQSKEQVLRDLRSQKYNVKSIKEITEKKNIIDVFCEHLFIK